MTDRLTILQGDSVECLSGLEADSIDLCVTSPPYDDIRTYGRPDGVKWDFEGTANQLKRVLKPGGIVAWVVGNQVKDWGETLTAERQRLYFQSVGFKVRKMIYNKLNFSAPSATHYHRLHEDITLCCKGKPKCFNGITDIPTVWKKAFGRNTIRERDGSMREQKQGAYSDTAKRGDVWIGPTAGQENPCKAIAHPATMPKWLARDLILSWSNAGDLVLDCFAGSGTTGLEALKIGRKTILIEKESDYVKLIEQRTNITAGLPL
jgi:DNA modification methylase